MEIYRKIFIDKAHREKHLTKIQNKYMKPDVVNQAREAFFMFDVDGTGELEMDEFKKVLESVGVTFDVQSWEGVVKELSEACDDGNRDNKVTFDEFLHFFRKFLSNDGDKSKLKKKCNRKLSKRETEEAHARFESLDKDGSGTLDKAELRPLLDSLNVSLGEEQFAHLVENIIAKGDGQAEGEKDGVLDFKEFLYFYKRCLRSADAQQKWEEKIAVRYQNEEMNYACGLD